MSGFEMVEMIFLRMTIGVRMVGYNNGVMDEIMGMEEQAEEQTTSCRVDKEEQCEKVWTDLES